MTNIFKNIRGTTKNIFRIGKTDVFTTSTKPSNSDGNDGSWCFSDDTNTPLVKRSGAWIDSGAVKIKTISGETYTYTSEHAREMVACNNNLPLTIAISQNVPEGREVIFKDGNGNSGTQTVTISCTNGITIDGSSTKTLDMDDASLRLISDGTNLFAV